MFYKFIKSNLNYDYFLGDITKYISQAMTFFGVIQRLYIIFSAFTEYWEILNRHLHSLTLKPICETR